VRLGEGVSSSRRLSEAAISRAMAALAICRNKMKNKGVTRTRLIATEACRTAEKRRGVFGSCVGRTWS
jgi:exopolyphosphatase/guanosine-5'-triphosphate,3'-diphosphate pyrophosphatase